MRIIEPTRDRHSVVRMENVRSRRVIDDNGIANGSSELRQIFDVISPVIVARFTEEAVFDDVMNIQMV